MNFLKSIVSDDPHSPKPENVLKSGPDSGTNQSQEDHAAVDHRPPPSTSADRGEGGVWSFGGLIQTITTRSESVLETYRRDLEEFGSGLKKETEFLRDAASRAVKELPASIEVAHGAIDGVIKSTAEIISSQTKESILSSDPETPETNRSTNSGRFSRLEWQLIALQKDINTYCEEPEDLEDYNKWKSGYSLTENSEEVESLMKENDALESIYKRVVPSEVDNETFWCRYFYRVDKLKQQESVRASLVRRAIGMDDDEEELSWDVDDDEYEETGDGKPKGLETRVFGDQGSVTNVEEGASMETRNVSVESNAKPIVENIDRGGVVELREESVSGSSDNKAKPKELETRELGDQSPEKNVKESLSKGIQNVGGKIDDERKESNPIAENFDEGDVVELKKESGSVSPDKLKESSQVINEEKKVKSEDGDEVMNAAKEVDLEEKVGSEGKSDQDGSGKETDVAILSSQQSVAEEEDFEWDEMEDIDSIDEKRVASLGMSSNRADVRKQLTVVEEDEDLSWDIEDDDEPVKKT